MFDEKEFEKKRQKLLKDLRNDIEAERKRRQQELARMSPEQRKKALQREKEERAASKKRAEEREKESKKRETLEKSLTEKELIIRKKVREIESASVDKTMVHMFKTKEIWDNYRNKCQEEMSKMIDELLAEAGKDINKVKKVLTEEEWRSFNLMYKYYLESREPLIWDSVVVG